MKTRKTREKELSKSYYDYISGGNVSEVHDKLLEIKQNENIILPLILKDILRKLDQYKKNNNIIPGKKLKQLAKEHAKNTIEILYGRN